MPTREHSGDVADRRPDPSFPVGSSPVESPVFQNERGFGPRIRRPARPDSGSIAWGQVPEGDGIPIRVG